MSPPLPNLHGTVIQLSGRGLVFLGPSGSGKSMLAFLTLSAALRVGLQASLVADDQFLLERIDGVPMAHCPPSISGLIEIRGTGIARLAFLPSTFLHQAIQPVDLTASERLPPSPEHVEIAPGVALPLLRIDRLCPDPLAVLLAFLPDFRR